MAPAQKNRQFTHLFEEIVTDLPGNRPTDPYLFALGLNGVLQELIREWAQEDPRPSTELLAETAVHIFLGGAQAETGRAPTTDPRGDDAFAMVHRSALPRTGKRADLLENMAASGPGRDGGADWRFLRV